MSVLLHADPVISNSSSRRYDSGCIIIRFSNEAQIQATLTSALFEVQSSLQTWSWKVRYPKRAPAGDLPTAIGNGSNAREVCATGIDEGDER